jgi:hypothetical protein
MPVLVVRLWPSLIDTPVDPTPVSYQDGGTIRIQGNQEHHEKPAAYRLTTAAQAFGAAQLRQPHAQTCKGQQRHVQQKSRSS